jgi:hypothetical protein
VAKVLARSDVGDTAKEGSLAEHREALRHQAEAE